MNASSLRETPVPAVLPSRSPRPVPTVVRLFADHGWAARMWFAVAMCSLFAALVEPYMVIAAYRTKERVVILDEAGTFHVSPLLNFEDATQLHTSQAILACIALFQKNPAGYDYPDLLEKMYLPDALEKAKGLRSAQAAEFSAKQIHQKVEIQKIDILQTRNDLVLVEVTGQLPRVGVFNGQPFPEAPSFKVRFTLVRNPNLTANGRFPLAVWKFDLL
jgi:hypothetical protein